MTTTPATASVAELDSGVPGASANRGLDGEVPVINNGGPDGLDLDDDLDDGMCDGDLDGEDECEFGFECIPLQSVCNEEDNDDIYFLDEYGNYVFPVSSSPTVQGSCSCHPSADELNSELRRRVSQVRILKCLSTYYEIVT